MREREREREQYIFVAFSLQFHQIKVCVFQNHIFTVFYQLHIMAIQHCPVAFVIDVVVVSAVLIFLNMVIFLRFCKCWCTK